MAFNFNLENPIAMKTLKILCTTEKFTQIDFTGVKAGVVNGARLLPRLNGGQVHLCGFAEALCVLPLHLSGRKMNIDT